MKKKKNEFDSFVTTLRSFFPRAKVTSKIELSSAGLYTMMISTGNLICKSSISDTSCLLSAFAQDPEHSAHYLVDSAAIIAAKQSKLTTQQQFFKDILDIKKPKNQQQLSKVLPNLNVIDLAVFSQFERRGDGCRILRGRYGKWVPAQQDLLPRLQYKTPIKHHPSGQADMMWREEKPQQFRPSTTYKWETSHFTGCSLDEDQLLFSKEQFCKVLNDLSIGRVLMIGDFVQHTQAMSLWKLMGHDDNPNNEDKWQELPFFSREIECADGHHIPFISILNEQLNANYGLHSEFPSFQKDRRNCGDNNNSMFCFPWVGRYLSSSANTLLVASVGSTHHTTTASFEDNVEDFFRTIDSFNRPEDIVLWRTLVPGHPNCGQAWQESPTQPSTKKGQNPSNEIYTWERFLEYNDYVERLLRNRPSNQLPKMELLDVYPMTIFREDGHVGGIEGPQESNNGPRDCINYNLPGPVDWWNHLLFRNLIDTAKEKQQKRSP